MPFCFCSAKKKKQKSQSIPPGPDPPIKQAIVKFADSPEPVASGTTQNVALERVRSLDNSFQVSQLLNHLQHFSDNTTRSELSRSLYQAPLSNFVELLRQLKQSNPKEGIEKEQAFIHNAMKSNIPNIFLLDINWAVNYTSYLDGKILDLEPITNSNLLIDKSLPVNSKFTLTSSSDQMLIQGLKQQQDYVLLNEKTWCFVQQMYGGGPEIILEPISEVNYEPKISPIYNLQPKTKIVQDQEKPNPKNFDSAAFFSNHNYETLSSLPFLELKPVGIRNPKFFCYMNSAIQCLLSISQMNHYFQDKSYQLNKNTQSFTLAYIELVQQVRELKNKRHPVIQLTNLQKLIEPHFSPLEQHDAHEFLFLLLSKLQEEFSEPSVSPQRRFQFKSYREALSHYCKTHKHIVDKLFMGQLTTYLTCSKCLKTSQVYEPFFDISLPIKQEFKSIYDCFDLYFKDEVIINELDCENCKHKSPEMKRAVKISSTPNVLMIEMKRFQIYPKKEKIKLPLKVDKKVDLKNYTCEKDKGSSYTLQAVIVHTGNVDNGHYVAYTKRQNKWYLLDDELVFSKSAAEIEQIQQGYVLFYEKD